MAMGSEELELLLDELTEELLDELTEELLELTLEELEDPPPEELLPQAVRAAASRTDMVRDATLAAPLKRE